MTSWCVVGVPLGVRFTRILKETATQGRVFVVYDVDMDQPCWVSQSLPALLAAYNQRRSHPSGCTQALHIASFVGSPSQPFTKTIDSAHSSGVPLMT